MTLRHFFQMLGFNIMTTWVMELDKLPEASGCRRRISNMGMTGHDLLSLFIGVDRMVCTAQGSGPSMQACLLLVFYLESRLPDGLNRSFAHGLLLEEYCRHPVRRVYGSVLMNGFQRSRARSVTMGERVLEKWVPGPDH